MKASISRRKCLVLAAAMVAAGRAKAFGLRAAVRGVGFLEPCTVWPKYKSRVRFFISGQYRYCSRVKMPDSLNSSTTLILVWQLMVLCLIQALRNSGITRGVLSGMSPCSPVLATLVLMPAMPMGSRTELIIIMACPRNLLNRGMAGERLFSSVMPRMDSLFTVRGVIKTPIKPPAAFAFCNPAIGSSGVTGPTRPSAPGGHITGAIPGILNMYPDMATWMKPTVVMA